MKPYCPVCRKRVEVQEISGKASVWCHSCGVGFRPDYSERLAPKCDKYGKDQTRKKETLIPAKPEEDRTSVSPKMKRAKLWIDGRSCVFANARDAMVEVDDFVREQDAPSEMRIELIDMSTEELDKLPEFEGW